MANHVDDALKPFIIQEVEGLDGEDFRPEGQGAYGVVFKVKVEGLPCIAKRMHEILVSRVSSEEQRTLLDKFKQECIVLSRLRHPNIVHFVGVHYGKIKGDFSLIMENLSCDLGEFLHRHPNMPLPSKLSVLLDVSYGLLYLHNHSPQVIHRDLSVQNVLMTTEGQAKIADLGVAKLLDAKMQATMTHTRNPGNYHYMPPEAQLECAQCTTKLDIFSFGHLSLYTVNQEPPEVFEVPLKAEMIEEGRIQIKKRKKCLDRMGASHCLHPLVMECLCDKPEDRPTTLQLNSSLKKLYTQHPKRSHHIMQICEAIEPGSVKGCHVDLSSQLEEANQTTANQKQRLEERACSIETQETSLYEIQQANDNLQQELNNAQAQIEILQAQVSIYKDDFEEERRDREKVQSKLIDLEMKESELKERIGKQHDEMKKMKKKGRVKWMKKKSDKMENIPDTMERITELEMSLKDYEHDKEKLASKNRDLMNEVDMLQDLVKKLGLDAQRAHQQQLEDLSPQELAMQEGMDDPFQPFDPYISLDTILEVQPGNDRSPPVRADGAVGGRDQEQVEPGCILPSSLNEFDIGSLKRSDSGSIQFKKEYYDLRYENEQLKARLKKYEETTNTSESQT